MTVLPDGGYRHPVGVQLDSRLLWDKCCGQGQCGTGRTGVFWRSEHRPGQGPVRKEAMTELVQGAGWEEGGRGCTIKAAVRPCAVGKMDPQQDREFHSTAWARGLGFS